MHLVEQHVIQKTDARFPTIDAACFASKNLYNAALYALRHHYIWHQTFLTSVEMDKRMQSHEAYQALPAKVAQQVLRVLEKNWISFFASLAEWKNHPEKFKARPRLPGYLDKTAGRNVLIYTMQAVSRSKRTLGRRIIQPSGLAIQVKTQQDPSSIDQVRIVPKSGFYVVEVIYEPKPNLSAVDPAWVAGIDVGMNNLAALTSNKPGCVPILVNGRGIKSTNQWYNKRLAQLQKARGRPGFTRQMQALTTRRTRRIDHDLHHASRLLIDLLIADGIGTLVIGKNEGWKQNSHLGTRTNQQFVQIPHARFIEMLTYKAQRVGITVILTEESYTSQASFVDRDPLPPYQKGKATEQRFSGKRITRGLYRTKEGRLINADLNGAGNIVRKVAPNAFGSDGVEDGRGHEPVVHPVKAVIPFTPRKRKRLPGPVSGFASV
ncbi:RNA-guided endonuclease InsQ/TnpB family protein [Tengunoibacter tsumagoiensis]|uniref:Transposase n=1 Tax=Tengunoibacter tsumagoiensis TaxID=2014871 RepID=A0A401ZZA6_9CHLR|nr:transposase [Tengunoibacter tsumagoiensis]GCE12178.1 transposase [Tengunoibacter tsumagoiensis]